MITLIGIDSSKLSIMGRGNMAKHISQTQRIITYMLAHGYKEGLSPTRRYRMFTPTVGENGRTYYVGKAGAVRCSKTGKVSDTYSVTDIFVKYVRLWELRLEREKDNEESTTSIP